MKTFKIPVTWEEYGIVEIEANSLEEALKIAETDENVPLPDEKHYVDGSWEVNKDSVILEALNKGE